MHVLVLAVEAGEWLRWATANWVGIFSMLAMLAFVLLLLVMALAPDPPPESRHPDDQETAERKRRDADPQRV